MQHKCDTLWSPVTTPKTEWTAKDCVDKTVDGGWELEAGGVWETEIGEPWETEVSTEIGCKATWTLLTQTQTIWTDKDCPSVPVTTSALIINADRVSINGFNVKV